MQQWSSASTAAMHWCSAAPTGGSLLIPVNDPQKLSGVPNVQAFSPQPVANSLLESKAILNMLEVF